MNTRFCCNRVKWGSKYNAKWQIDARHEAECISAQSPTLCLDADKEHLLPNNNHCL